MVARFEHGSPGFRERWLQNLPKGRSVMPRLSRPSVLFLPVRTLPVRTLAARTRDTLSASGGAQPDRSRRGCTLIELLVVMMIIAILASMISFAMSRVQKTARKAATQALITKLHSVIARQWDTYATRRVEGADAAERLDNLRLEMQYELPDCQAGVTGNGGVLQAAYHAAISGEWPTTDPVSENPEHDQSAVCLYLIVSMLADDDLDRINFFSEQEVGDLDKDGTPDVFVDAWGEPIGFIRWPAGFVDDASNPSLGHLSDLQQDDPTGSPDPFDPRGVGTGAIDNYAIFPLIYSKGPDKRSGIDPANPASPDPYSSPKAGAPDGTGDHHDNIHNHHLGGSLR